MSNPYLYHPKVTHPNLPNDIPQMRSQAFQMPFYFGGSQVPINLGLKKGSYSGSGFVGDKPPKYTDGKYHILKQELTKGKGIYMPSRK